MKGYRDMQESHSVSPRRTLRKVSAMAASEKSQGFADTRQSLLADKQQLDRLHLEDHENDAPPDDETLLERVARRVAAKRHRKTQLQRAKTDGEKLASMQEALRRRKEMEREDDEKIGGIWAMGLKALEKVYDDING